jgi:23S rRNA pseudouridine1911/1915/1917 synthase
MRKSAAPRPPAAVRPREFPPDAVGHAFRVPPESAGLRLDWFLRREFRDTSRTRAQAIIARSAFDLEGHPLRRGSRVRAGEWVVLWRPAFTDREPERALPVLYQDEHLLGVDKPAPLVVHPTAGHHRHTALRRLYLDYPGERLTLVHRLDRDTSGVLLVARSRAADAAAKRLLELRAVEKTYFAITRGIPDAQEIVLPLERDPVRRGCMRTAAPGRGAAAHTSIEVLGQKGGHALLVCRISTGRQHQIRVHLASIGCPVVGDRRYGTEDPALLRHALHAHRYRLPHPITGEAIDIVSPLPDDLGGFWGAIG